MSLLPSAKAVSLQIARQVRNFVSEVNVKKSAGRFVVLGGDHAKVSLVCDELREARSQPGSL